MMKSMTPEGSAILTSLHEMHVLSKFDDPSLSTTRGTKICLSCDFVTVPLPSEKK